MRKRFGLAMLVAGLAFSPAAAQAPEDGETDEERVIVPDINASTRIICRNIGPPPGSRIGARRICKTEAEWNRLRAEGVQTQYITIHSSARESDTPRLNGGGRGR